MVMDCELAGHYWKEAGHGETGSAGRGRPAGPGHIVEVGPSHLVLRDGGWLIASSEVDPGLRMTLSPHVARGGGFVARSPPPEPLKPRWATRSHERSGLCRRRGDGGQTTTVGGLTQSTRIPADSVFNTSGRGSGGGAWRSRASSSRGSSRSRTRTLRRSGDVGGGRRHDGVADDSGSVGGGASAVDGVDLSGGGPDGHVDPEQQQDRCRRRGRPTDAWT